MQNAAKKSNIDPKSISAYESGVIIYLDPARAVFMKGGRDKKEFDLEEDENIKQ